MNYQKEISLAVKDLIKILNENNINYWIDFGTLLGAVRDKNIIEWDRDADISMTEGELKKTLQLIPEIQNIPSIELINISKDKSSEEIKLLPEKEHWLHVGWFIDIYGWKIWPDYIVRNWGGMSGIDNAPIGCAGKDQIFPLKEMSFLGETAKIPNKPEARLKHLYGNWEKPVQKVPFWGGA